MGGTQPEMKRLSKAPAHAGAHPDATSRARARQARTCCQPIGNRDCRAGSQGRLPVEVAQPEAERMTLAVGRWGNLRHRHAHCDTSANVAEPALELPQVDGIVVIDTVGDT